MDSRRFLLLVAVVALFVSGAAGVAFGQAGEAPAAGNETAATNETAAPGATSGNASGAPGVPVTGTTTGPGVGSGNATGNETGNASSAGGGGGSGGGGGPVDAAQDAAQGAINAGASMASGGAEAAANLALGPFYVFALEIPTLDIGLTEAGAYHAPDNWPYDVLFTPLYVYVALPITLVTFGVLTFTGFASIPFASLPHTWWNTHSAGSRAIRALAALFGGVVFHLIGFSVVHRLFAGFAEELVGSPAELVEAMGLLDFSLATAFIGMGLYEMGWDIIKWIGVMYAIILIYLIFFPMVSMPFTATWLYAPRSSLGKFSGYLHLTHLAFLFSKAAVAVQLFAASLLDWGASFDGVTAGFVSLGLIASAGATPPVMLILMWLSKGRLISAVGAGAGAAAGSSAVAAKVREKNPVDTKEVKEKGKSHAKRKAAAAQGKYWDVKNRTAAMASVAKGSAAGAAYAGKDRLERWRSDEPGAGSSSRTAADGGRSPTRSERLRRFEDMNDRAGGLSASQRKRYFNLKMEEKGAFDSGLDTSEGKND